MAAFVTDGMRTAPRLGDCRVTELRRLTGGESAQTWRFRVSSENGEIDDLLIARWYQDEATAGFSSPEREYLMLDVAAAAGVPVPEVVAFAAPVLEGDPTPLLLTRFVSGSAPSPWAATDRAETRRLQESERFRSSFVETLVKIHETETPEPVRREDGERGRTMAQREFDRAVRDTARAGFHRDPVVVYATEWLRRWLDRCDLDDRELTHGDYRLGNLIVDDEQVAAVLDWEGAQGGSGLYDLAWLIAPVGTVGRLAGGLMEAGELIDRYLELRPEVRVGDLQGLAVLSGLRNLGTWLALAGIGTKRIGDGGARLRRFTSALKVRADLLEPVFGGTAFYRIDPSSRRPAGDLAALAAKERAAAPALANLAARLGRTSDAPAFAVAAKTASLLQRQGGTVAASPGLDVAFARLIESAPASADLFGTDGPADPEVRELLRDWASFEAGWLLERPREIAGL